MKLTIISDKGSPMIVIQRVRRKADTLEITGQLMGAWPSKMYITPEQFGAVVLAALTPSVLLYVLLFPWFWLMTKLRRGKHPPETGYETHG